MWLNIIKAVGTVCISTISLIGVWDLFHRNKEPGHYNKYNYKNGKKVR